MHNELLLELYSEEIPYLAAIKAVKYAEDFFEKELKSANVNFSVVEVTSGPRRLAIVLKDLAYESSIKSEKIKGPKVDSPEIAISKFLEKYNVDKSSVLEENGYLYIEIMESLNLKSLLIKIVNNFIKSIPWPKNMLWAEHKISWIRPLKNILCIFQSKILEGIEFGHLHSNNITFGHHVLFPESLVINSYMEYVQKLETRKVMVNQHLRKAKIIGDAAKLCELHSVHLEMDENLVAEIAALVEYPFMMVGKIDHFLVEVLPRELIELTLKKNQRYMICEKADKTLAPLFIFAANINVETRSKVVSGNEKVVRARLHDAMFFYEQDRKKGLALYVEKLKDLNFHHKLGNMYDKSQRLFDILQILNNKLQISSDIKLEKLASLMKADLASVTVSEFPELQGIVGYYLFRDVEKEIALAIKEQYYRGEVLENISKLGYIGALSDKFDTLISLFLAGERPTGSKDPFALRRQAIAIIKIIEFAGFDLDLIQVIKEFSAKSFKEFVSDQGLKDVENFMLERLKNHLKNTYKSELVEDLCAIQNEFRINKLIEDVKKVQQFLGTREGLSLAGAFKRVHNILEIEEKRDKTGFSSLNIVQKTLNDDEQNLVSEIEKLKGVNLLKLEAIGMQINHYLDNTLVNDNDAQIRANRLNLLAKIREFASIYPRIF